MKLKLHTNRTKRLLQLSTVLPKRKSIKRKVILRSYMGFFPKIGIASADRTMVRDMLTLIETGFKLNLDWDILNPINTRKSK